MISDLIYKELIEEITPEESRVLKKWLEEPANRALYDRIRQKKGLGRRLCEYVDVDSQKDFRSTLPAPAPVAPRRGLRYALYAAAIVPLLVAVTFFGARFGESGRTDVRHPEIMHNSEGARLILSSGQVVDLADDEGRPSFWPRRMPSSMPAMASARSPTKSPKRRLRPRKLRSSRRLPPCIRWSCRAA